MQSSQSLWKAEDGSCRNCGCSGLRPSLIPGELPPPELFSHCSERFPGVLKAGRAFPSILPPWGSRVPAGTVPTAWLCCPGAPGHPGIACQGDWWHRSCQTSRAIYKAPPARPRSPVMNGVIISAQSYPAPQQNSLLAAAGLGRAGQAHGALITFVLQGEGELRAAVSSITQPRVRDYSSPAALPQPLPVASPSSLGIRNASWSSPPTFWCASGGKISLCSPGLRWGHLVPQAGLSPAVPGLFALHPPIPCFGNVVSTAKTRCKGIWRKDLSSMAAVAPVLPRHG